MEFITIVVFILIIWGAVLISYIYHDSKKNHCTKETQNKTMQTLWREHCEEMRRQERGI